jgi:uncharacterized protein (DUF488 family)
MIFTIGYERASLADFVSTLELSSVDILVDIRDRAQSRRPGFSKNALKAALNLAGIDYLHMRELGDPKEGREAARKGDFGRFREIFANVIASKEAIAALAALEKLASNSAICLMCFERDQTTCHRSIVSALLEQRLGKRTRHLGVSEGVGRQATNRRVPNTYQGAAASI